MAPTVTQDGPGTAAASSRIDIGFTLEVSGLPDVTIRRKTTLPVVGEEIVAAERQLAEKLDREVAKLRQMGKLFLRIAQWRIDLQGEFDRLEHQNVAMHLDVRSDETLLTVDFRAEYIAADIPPLVHPVKFPMSEEVPSPEEVIRRLEEEWWNLRRLFTVARAVGKGAVTQAIPIPFSESRGGRDGQDGGIDRDVQPPARAATPEEAKKFIERYLDHFRFPIEVEERGVRYGFIPRVAIAERGDAVKLTVTVLMPPTGGEATLQGGGSKSVVVPLDEIYVRGEELNRKTKEGILALVKGLCITLGRERGLASDIDITRPR